MKAWKKDVKKLRKGFWGCLAFCVAGLFLFLFGHDVNPWGAGFTIVFFGLGSIKLGYELLNPEPLLVIDSSGMAWLSGNKKITWDYVETVFVSDAGNSIVELKIISSIQSENQTWSIPFLDASVDEITQVIDSHK
jgi:hypothetical protein